MTPRDFRIDAMHLRWQPLPAGADTLALARAWLDVVATGAGVPWRDPRGRPRLPAGAGDIGWSHTSGRILMAYTPRGAVGVDVEASGRTCRALPIARRFFAPTEIKALAALDDTGRQQAFLRLWCAKEAVLKASGHGIAFGLHRVVFDVEGPVPRMTHCDPALGNASDWGVQQLAPEHGFIAVLTTSAG